jgi:hypothetical protein
LDFRRHRRTPPRGKKKNGARGTRREGILRKMNLKVGTDLGATESPRTTKIDRQDRMAAMKVNVRSAMAMNRVPTVNEAKGRDATIALAVGGAGVAGVAAEVATAADLSAVGTSGAEEATDATKGKNARGAMNDLRATRVDPTIGCTTATSNVNHWKRPTLNSASKAT